MEVVFQLGSASVAEVQEKLGDRLSYSSVRTMLRILEEKGHVRHTEEGQRYIYSPTDPPDQAASNAVKQVLKVFFGGSSEKLVAALLSDEDLRMDKPTLDRLEAMIENAREDAKDE